MTKTQKQIIGDLGEGISCNYLKNKGFSIVERNYWKPWGEIDIIAQENGILHFVEVKTVTRETLELSNHYNKENNHKTRQYVSYETLNRLRIKGWNVIRETLFRLSLLNNDVIHETNQIFLLKKPKDFLRLDDGSGIKENVIRETISSVKLKEIAKKESDLRKIRRIRDLDLYRPEDNLHPWKLKRLSRVLQSYLLNKNISEDQDWQFDVITVYLDISNKTAKIECLEDIVL